MLSPRLRRWASLLAATPFHPQWLLRSGPNREQLLTHARGRVLDVGCANRWPERILPEGCQYLALDYPATGSDLYDSRPDVFADAACLPFADNSIDTVLFFEVLEHVANPQRTLSEITRVLKPGGMLVMSMPFLYPMHDEPHDYQRYTRHGLMRELQAAKLDVSDVEPNLSSAATAGLMANLALSGMALEALRRRRPAVILIPLVVLSIPLINLCTWVLSKLFPGWTAMTAGHNAIASKP